MSAVRKVLIVGGGLAGLSAAVVLAKRGVDVEVAEISSSLRPPGSGIGVNGPSVRALRMVDEQVLRDCIANGFGHRRMGFGGADGQVRRQVELRGLAGPEFPGGFGIMRAVFWELLADAAREAGARIRLEVTATAITQDSAEVVVSLSDGSQVGCDLVVGADGLRSKTREMAFPEAPSPSFAGQTAWRVVVPRHPEVSEGINIFIGSHGGRVGCNPVSPEEMYVFIGENMAEPTRPGQEDWPELLRELLSDYGGVIAWARERVGDPSKIDRRVLYSLLMPAPWHSGRVVLIGDAVHAPTPHLVMGAGIALEDAVVLGEVLDSHADVASALAQFNKRRWERCRLVVENSLQLCLWDQHPDDPHADAAGLSDASFAAMAAPF